MIPKAQPKKREAKATLKKDKKLERKVKDEAKPKDEAVIEPKEQTSKRQKELPKTPFK